VEAKGTNGSLPAKFHHSDDRKKKFQKENMKGTRSKTHDSLKRHAQHKRKGVAIEEGEKVSLRELTRASGDGLTGSQEAALPRIGAGRNKAQQKKKCHKGNSTSTAIRRWWNSRVKKTAGRRGLVTEEKYLQKSIPTGKEKKRI